MRVLFHVQHLLGVGHLKRADILTNGMAADGFKVTVAFGGQKLAEAPFAGAELVMLPAATIAGEDFSTLRDTDGKPVGADWKKRRTARLLETFHAVRPDIVLIELFPFGRRQFRFELLPLLEAARAARPRPVIACSVRDILVTRKPGRAEETVDTLRRFFDAVLVHGDPAFIPLEATFPLTGAIADMVYYTGYVRGSADHAMDEGDGEVLVSAGGGAVGAGLLLAAVEARPTSPLADKVWRFLAGPNLPESVFRRLSEHADSRTLVERFQPDFAARLGRATLSISQAGYNTIIDVLSAGVPAVVVPYEARGETEQRLRADVLARKGFLTVVPEAELNPARLAAAIGTALAKPQSPRIDLDLSGAATTPRLLRSLPAGRGAI
jgi:predicted glycosyltransferase